MPPITQHDAWATSCPWPPSQTLLQGLSSSPSTTLDPSLLRPRELAQPCSVQLTAAMQQAVGRSGLPAIH